MPRRRIAPSLAILATLAAVTLPLLAPSPAEAATPLRTLAAAKGKFIGFAAATGPLANEPAYTNIAATEFNQITPENALKWDATEPNDNQYSFTGADQIVAFAAAHDQVVHGHTLVWHSQTPGWVQGLSATAMRTAMQDHISTVVGRYAANPVVGSWDVVNEAFDDNGNFRTSFWYNTLGQGYIADAFRFARAADADAKLCINDYNIEGVNAKSTAVYNLVQSLKAQGVPIDCVGIQGHLAIQYGFPGQVAENIARFAALGVTVRFTELDVRMQLPRDATKDTTQAQYYTNVVNACLASTACTGVTIWGFTDKYSWVPNTFSGQGAALVYDENYAAKPAYNAINTALGGTSGGDTTPPSAPSGLAASGVTTTSANLSWTASTDNVGVTGYDILQAAGASGGTFSVVGTSTTTSAAVGSLTAGSTYRFQVRARDAAGNVSAVSNTTTVTTSSGGGTGGCSATGTVQTSWQNGYVIQPLTITNTGSSTINSWTVTVTLPAGHVLTGSWNAVVTTSGQTVTFKPLSWNGTIAPGTSNTSVGFQASRPDGTTAVPSAYACTTP